MKIDRAISMYIEHELYSYDDIKKELEFCREEIIEGESKPEVAVQGGIGNKTENKTIKLLSSKFIGQSKKNIKAIDRTLDLLGATYKEFFMLKYLKGLSKIEVLVEMHISESTYFRYKRELITMVAIDLGIINY